MGYKFEWSTCRVSSIQKRYRIILCASKTEELLEDVDLEPVYNWWDFIKDVPAENSDKEPMQVEFPTWKFRIGRRCKLRLNFQKYLLLFKKYFQVFNQNRMKNTYRQPNSRKSGITATGQTSKPIKSTMHA